MLSFGGDVTGVTAQGDSYHGPLPRARPTLRQVNRSGRQEWTFKGPVSFRSARTGAYNELGNNEYSLSLRSAGH
jgi:hypothetical protein